MEEIEVVTTRYGKSRTYSDGSKKIESSSAIVSISSDGEVTSEITGGTVAVTFNSIAVVRKHRITGKASGAIHTIELVNGAKLKIEFDSDGSLIDLSGKGFSVDLEKKNVFVVGYA